MPPLWDGPDQHTSDNAADTDVESARRNTLSRAESERKTARRTDWIERTAGSRTQHWRCEMEVILKEDVANLGHRGDVVKVADGYGRNFLLPRKLALQATVANKAVIDQMKAAAARRSATEKVQAEELLSKLEPVVLTFTRKSGDHGQLFGSVTSADIAAELATKGFDIDRRKIQLSEPLKALGNFDVAIRLHREVTAHLKVKVLGDAVEESPAAEPAAETVAE